MQLRSPILPKGSENGPSFGRHNAHTRDAATGPGQLDRPISTTHMRAPPRAHNFKRCVSYSAPEAHHDSTTILMNDQAYGPLMLTPGSKVYRKLLPYPREAGWEKGRASVQQPANEAMIRYWWCAHTVDGEG